MKFSPQFKKIIPYLILIVFGFLLYYQTLFFSFVYLDDNRLIIDNQQILVDSGLLKIFTSDVFFSGAGTSFYYRPLLNVSFLIDSLFGGSAPFFFHLTNLILHLISAGLIFLILKKHFFSKETSYFLALIFLSHPALAQAVAWIPGRNDSLLTIFILLSFYLFLNFLKTDKLKYLWWHIAFFILALFVKETAVFLPILCVAYYYLYNSKFNKENKQDNTLIILVAWFVSGFIWFLFRKVSLSGNSFFTDLFLSGLQNFPAVLVYLGKTIFPFNLSVYPILKNSTYWFGAFSLLLISFGLYLTKKINIRHLLFGLAWFLIFLFPSFLNPDPTSVLSFLEHRLYLPVFGLLICFAEIFPLKDLPWQKAKIKIVALLIILLFSGLTFFHTQNFSDRLIFWNEAAKNSPSSAFAHNNLGAMEYLAGNLDKAREQYLLALEIDPNQRLVHNNLGLIAASNKNFSEAESEYKKELALNPYYDNAWTNLGIMYLNQKRLTESKAAFTEAYRLNPSNYEAYNGLLILSSNW